MQQWHFRHLQAKSEGKGLHRPFDMSMHSAAN